jgi:glycosyltransferase involved in cell wall biosynthesis
MARYEVEVCEQFDQVVFVSDEDRAALRNQGRNQHNADRDAVIPISLQPPTSVRRAISTGRNVVFLGGLNWPPNADGVAWFLREVWPLVCAQAPDARFTVVGKIPRSLRLDRNQPSVEFAGYLPSTDTVLDGAAAFVVPLRSGGGMRVKILEAWSRSLPVVSTVVGAEGLAVGPDQNIRLADDPGTFAAHIVALLKDPAAAAALGRGGRQTVDAHYDWRNQYAAWDQVYRCAFSS